MNISTADKLSQMDAKLMVYDNALSEIRRENAIIDNRMNGIEKSIGADNSAHTASAPTSKAPTPSAHPASALTSKAPISSAHTSRAFLMRVSAIKPGVHPDATPAHESYVTLYAVHIPGV